MTQQVLAFADDRDGHIPCPTCGTRLTQVKDSRGSVVQDIPTIRRRRSCTACNERFTTYEIESEVFDRLFRTQSAKVAMALRIVEMIDEEVRSEMVKRLQGTDVTPCGG